MLFEKSPDQFVGGNRHRRFAEESKRRRLSRPGVPASFDRDKHHFGSFSTGAIGLTNDSQFVALFRQDVGFGWLRITAVKLDPTLHRVVRRFRSEPELLFGSLGIVAHQCVQRAMEMNHRDWSFGMHVYIWHGASDWRDRR